MRSRKCTPLALLISSSPMVVPPRVSSRGANAFCPRSTLSVGSSKISLMIYLLLCLLLDFFGSDLTTAGAACQSRDCCRKAACGAAGNNNNNTVECREFGEECVVSWWFGRGVLYRQHTDTCAFATVDARLHFAKRSTNLLKQKLAQIIL